MMNEAEIKALQECSKGLRHGFGVYCIMCDVPLHLIKKWMGHESIETPRKT